MNFVFDLYGTLVDIRTNERPAAFWRAVCRELGTSRLFWRSVKCEYLSLCRAKKRSDEHEIDLIEVFREMLKKRGRTENDAGGLALAFREASTEKLQLFGGVKDMLISLREAGAGVYLLSNAQSCFTRHEIELLGLDTLFDGIIISSEVGVKKPSPKIFHIAFERFGISPGDSVYVGNDLRDDVLGATTVGMRTAYIQTEQSGEYPSLTLPSPTYVAADHEELSRLLLSLI